jgi:hypothetical protein
VVVNDGANGLVAVWADNRSGNSDIYAVRYNLFGQLVSGWPANGLALCTASGDQTDPVIASDSHGGAFVAWRDRRCGTRCVEVYLQHVTVNGVIPISWPANGLLVGSLSDPTQDGPAITADGTGGVMVAWAQGSIQIPALPELRALRVAPTGVLAAGWSAGGIVLCDAVYHPNPVVTSDLFGGGIVAWQHLRPNGTDFDLYAAHALLNGLVDPDWPACGLALCALAGDQTHPDIVSDGVEGAIVAWEDARDGTTRDIYAQRVGYDGTLAPGWPASGLAVCTDPADQHRPRLTGDRQNGAYVAWEDDRNPADSTDIYAAHVTFDGTSDPQWPDNGFAVCTALDLQTEPRLTSDNAGGTVVTWEDWRAHSFPDVYAVRVTSIGTRDPNWPSNGLALCNAGGAQSAPAIVSSGVGGAIVVWQDDRGIDDDVYGQQVTRDGSVPTLVSLISADAATDHVRLSWMLSHDDAAELTVYRSSGSGWASMGSPVREGAGRVAFEDRAVVPGSHLGYRLGVRSSDAEWFGGEVWIDVPRSPTFVLDGVKPNPVVRSASVRFSLPDASPARLELIDPAGRRVFAREVGTLGAGSHVIPFEVTPAPAPGVYLLRLTSSALSRSIRVVVAR